MKIAFFTEAGSKRGMGHLIRCQTIANEFEQNNIEINFFFDGIDIRKIRKPIVIIVPDPLVNAG